VDVNVDLAIVGGGIVGLATALQFARARPGRSVLVLEKETEPGTHQTGHNSGVIHSGLYYKPGTARARLAVTGSVAMKAFCRERGIPFEECGKVVVATMEEEFPALEELHRRGTANGVPRLAMIGAEGIRAVEPHAAGLRALHVPEAAIVDYRQVAQEMRRSVEGAGVVVRTGARVKAIRTDEHAVTLRVAGAGSEAVTARAMIGCAGLHADRVARLEGARPEARIVPFRGEYYQLTPEACRLVRGLIYPVPDARFPFLGVHLTRMIGGGVEGGPNAVLALAREGYRRWKLNPRDLSEMALFPGFWRMTGRYWRTGFGEMWRSFSKGAFVDALARLVPDLTADDVERGGAGVRAQALMPTGQLADDFVIVERPRALHVCNAPSPAATASLALGEEIARRACAHFTDLQ
jgi:L-2-hydroxyglutarate oxidase